MIPKQISESTRILALGVVLACPVWGWAVEFDFVMPDPLRDAATVDARCWWTTTPSNVPIRLTCEPVLASSPGSSCYQRMREAMKAMDAMHQITLGEWALNKELQKKAGRAGMELWEKTMKDCVEGGK